MHCTRRRLQFKHCGTSLEQRTFCSRQASHALLALRLSGRTSTGDDPRASASWWPSEAAWEKEQAKERRSQLLQIPALPSHRTLNYRKWLVHSLVECLTRVLALRYLHCLQVSFGFELVDLNVVT